MLAKSTMRLLDAALSVTPGPHHTLNWKRNRRWLQLRNQRRLILPPARLPVRQARWSGLEVQLRAKLEPARIRHGARCFSEVRAMRSVDVGHAGVIAPQIVVIESVEDIHRQANSCRTAAELHEIFPQPHVDALIREGARNCESAGLEVRTESCASDIDPLLATERCQAGPLYSPQPGHVGNPVADQAVLLIVRRL